MPPVPVPASRVAYRDERDRLELTNAHVAAWLILNDHRLLQVLPRQGRQPLYIFDRSAQPATDRFMRAIEEVLAHRERALQGARA